MPAPFIPLPERTRQCLQQLGACASLPQERNLPFYADATELVVAETSRSGYEHLLTPKVAKQWILLKRQAQSAGVKLIIVSAFRSFERQMEIVERTSEAGADIGEVLLRLAPPGCSQHHTGRAIDIGTPGCEPASLAFEETKAFRWLCENAGNYMFSLSYPKDNPYGFIYEPWHWYHGAEKPPMA